MHEEAEERRAAAKCVLAPHAPRLHHCAHRADEVGLIADLEAHLVDFRQINLELLQFLQNCVRLNRCLARVPRTHALQDAVEFLRRDVPKLRDARREVVEERVVEFWPLRAGAPEVFLCECLRVLEVLDLRDALLDVFLNGGSVKGVEHLVRDARLADERSKFRASRDRLEALLLRAQCGIKFERRGPIAHAKADRVDVLERALAEEVLLAKIGKPLNGVVIVCIQDVRVRRERWLLSVEARHVAVAAALHDLVEGFVDGRPRPRLDDRRVNWEVGEPARERVDVFEAALCGKVAYDATDGGDPLGPCGGWVAAGAFKGGGAQGDEAAQICISTDEGIEARMHVVAVRPHTLLHARRVALEAHVDVVRSGGARLRLVGAETGIVERTSRIAVWHNDALRSSGRGIERKGAHLWEIGDPTQARIAIGGEGVAPLRSADLGDGRCRDPLQHLRGRRRVRERLSRPPERLRLEGAEVGHCLLVGAFAERDGGFVIARDDRHVEVVAARLGVVPGANRVPRVGEKVGVLRGERLDVVGGRGAVEDDAPIGVWRERPHI